MWTNNMNLTEAKIKKIKSKDKPFRVPDGNGLYLFVDKNGSKKWQFRFTWVKNGKKTRPWQSLGKYPIVSLKQARMKVIESHGLLEEGINPIQQQRNNSCVLQEQEKQCYEKSFEEVLNEFFEFKSKPRGENAAYWEYSTLKKHNERFYNYVIPILGNKVFSDVTKDDLKEVLLKIDLKGTLSIRDKVRSVLRGLYEWAEEQKYVSHNKALLIPKFIFSKRKSKNYPHVTTSYELAPIVRDLEHLNSSYEVQNAIKLLMYVFCRPSNVTNLRWEQINFKECLIEIPGAEMKTGKDFLIPLSKQALAIIEEMRPITGHSSYVFLSPYNTSRPVSEGSLVNALKRSGINEIVPHGFRHTASTILNNLKYFSDAIEVQLSHVVPGVRGVYNKAQYLDERKIIMQAWADLIDSLK